MQLPTEAEVAHARGSLSGRNRALLDTVAAAIKEDLLRVKDALDLHLRTKQTGVADLQPQVEALGRVADTLGMMGLGVARNVVLQQRDAMHEIVYGSRAADEGALLDVAGALLYVDASLDDQVARLGRVGEDGDDDPIANESRKVLDVLVREAIANFGDARQSFVAFVETNWDHAELAEVPRLLDEVVGALRILELPQPADYLTGIRRYTETELIGRKRVPERPAAGHARRRAGEPGVLPRGPARPAPEPRRHPRHRAPEPGVAALLAAAGDGAAAEAPVLRVVETTARPTPTTTAVAEDSPPTRRSRSRQRSTRRQRRPPSLRRSPAPTHAPAPVASGAAGGFEATGDEIDDEIREVFLEEFEEEISNLDELLPPWRDAPEDMEKLRPIRRVFHTLKGSGRLVGAKTLGEFSWKIENMLNRVLDGTRAASPAVVAMVDQTFYTLAAIARRAARRSSAGRRPRRHPGGRRPPRRRRGSVLHGQRRDAGARSRDGEVAGSTNADDRSAGVADEARAVSRRRSRRLKKPRSPQGSIRCCWKSSIPKSAATWSPSTPGWRRRSRPRCRPTMACCARSTP